MNQVLYVAVIILSCSLYSCDMDSGITSNYQRVNTDELVLKGKDGNYYQITINEQGELEALMIEN